MGLLLFNSLNEYTKFFDSMKKNMTDSIEYRLFRHFKENRMLVLAEHAFTERIPARKYGKGAYIGIGDKNTDMLAKIAAFSTGSAYIIPWVSRHKIDFARDPKLLGHDNKLLVNISYSKNPQKKYVRIHTDRSYLPVFIKYCGLIKKLKPGFILSYHGMHLRHSMDIMIGAGPNFRYLGGKAKAERFADFVKNTTNEKLKELGFNVPLDIKLSKWLFSGNKNYTLAGYSKKGVIGCQVEFNLRGRTSEKLGMPKRKFQIAAQLLPQCMMEFDWD